LKEGTGTGTGTGTEVLIDVILSVLSFESFELELKVILII
jgi:hypothetical protein